MTTATTDDGKTEVDPKLDESQGKPDDETIPKRQFLAALKSATEKTDAALREAAEAKRLVAELTKKQEPKPPTRAELQKFVEAGDLSQEQMDAVLQKQADERTAKIAAETTSRTLAGTAYQQRVEAELAGYRELKPAAWEEGSPERTKAKAEYDYLVSMGDPQNLVTEAKALRAAFGDLSTLRAASKDVRPGPSDTHSETGGGKPAGGGKSDPLKLNADQKAYYQKGIDSGRYKDWAAVGEELKYAKKR